MNGRDTLPAINSIGPGAPLGWLAGAWQDMRRALVPCLVYGAAIAVLCVAIAAALVLSNASFWALVLTCGLVFIAPMLAMGLYEAGRLLEQGETPTLSRMIFVKSAFGQDSAYLGVTLLLIYMLWGRIAQLVYGLSTYRLHETVEKFAVFAFTTEEGLNMLLTGSIIGGVIAFFTFAVVVISAPMLLDRGSNFFAATVTSFTAVAANPLPMLIWAAIIAALIALSALTAFAGLVVVFPLLGLASWRAYRELVEEREPARESAAS